MKIRRRLTALGLCILLVLLMGQAALANAGNNATLTEAEFTGMALEQLLKDNYLLLDQGMLNIDPPDAYKYLVDAGLAEGYSVEIKNPAKEITRLEAALYLAQLMNTSIATNEENSILGRFADKGQIPAAYRQAVAGLVKNNIFGGESETVNNKVQLYFCPAKPLTRVEAQEWLSKIAIAPAAAGAGSAVKLVVNGKQVAVDVPPYLDKAGRTMVPIRFLFQELGAQVDWDHRAKQVTMTGKGVAISLKVGQKTARVNEKAVTLDTVAVIKNGRVMVPLRFIAEALGAVVQWDAAQRIVTVDTAGGF